MDSSHEGQQEPEIMLLDDSAKGTGVTCNIEENVIDLDDSARGTSVTCNIEENAIDIIENPLSVQKAVEPYEGMEFQSADCANDYYSEYARGKGFRTRLGRKNYSRKDNSFIAQEFLCSCEGFRSEKCKNIVDRVLPIPDETRTGCKAMMKVSKRGESKWVVTSFELEHNHGLASLKSIKFLPKRKKSTPQLNLIDVLDESEVRPSKIMSVLATEAGGIDRVCLNESSVRNYLSNKRQKNLEKGDAHLMLTYFREQQAKNPGFFYAIQADVEGHLANCFWVDARSRMAYKYFGDVVTFDPTYLTNKYRMPFVPFTSVNHHRQSILFGCALLWDETEESFEWLLRTWLKAMFGQPPRTIITDQDKAITNAVRTVFPNSVHHFCMWHILKKVPEVLGRVYSQNQDFKSNFSKCIHQTLTPEDFELAWRSIIQMYGLEKNDWLNKIYSVREKWVPAYLRNTFCAGMSTTQRSESMNKYFKDYVGSSTSMSIFVLQYEKALDARFDKQREKNFKTKNSRPVLKTKYPMETQAANLYTRKIFRLFQEELIESQTYISQNIEVIEGVHKYKVREFNKDKPEYLINMNPVSEEVVCTCHKFEFEGILCRHILRVLIKENILSLPSRYILNRWTINATSEKVIGLLGEEVTNHESRPSTLWFNSTMVFSLSLSERSSRSQNHYDTTMAGLQALCDKLDLLPVPFEDNGTAKDNMVIQNHSSPYIPSQTLPISQDENITLLDPPHVVSKGRPRTIRMKGHLEKNKKACSVCKVKGHTRPTCPNLEQATNSEAN